MYAVIRSGGKQYRVSPGDTIRIEKVAAEPEGNGAIVFDDVLAVAGEDRPMAQPRNAKVTGTVLGQGRGDKVLVFHFKRKKQYKKRQGHRQAFTAVRIDSIEVEGQSYSAPKQAAAEHPSRESSTESASGAAAAS